MWLAIGVRPVGGGIGRAISEDALIAELMVCNLTPCDAARTVNIVKGVCTAVLASAGVMVH